MVWSIVCVKGAALHPYCRW